MMTLRTRTIAVGRKGAVAPFRLTYTIDNSKIQNPNLRVVRKSISDKGVITPFDIAISQLIVRPSTSCTIVCMCQPYVKENIMGYYKSQLIEQQEEHRLGNIDQDYESQVTSELDQAIADGDTERAMYLASVIDITIQ